MGSRVLVFQDGVAILRLVRRIKRRTVSVREKPFVWTSEVISVF